MGGSRFDFCIPEVLYPCFALSSLGFHPRILYGEREDFRDYILSISCISDIFNSVQRNVVDIPFFYFFSSKRKVVSVCHIISVLIFISNLWSNIYIWYGKQKKHVVEKPPHGCDSVRIKSIYTVSFHIKETNDLFLISFTNLEENFWQHYDPKACMQICFISFSSSFFSLWAQFWWCWWKYRRKWNAWQQRAAGVLDTAVLHSQKC